MTLEEILAARPEPGQPRDYHFPDFARTVLPAGLQVLTVHVPGRPLVSANLVVRRGAGDEPATLAGATILAARAMTEGTERYPGVELTEAAERLGATLHADASWDGFGASVDVAGSRLGAALELLAELVERPTFPDEDVARLREERLNDLLQVRADPRRRVELAFTSTIYSDVSPYARPAGGKEETVRLLDPAALRKVHGTLLDPAQAAIVIGGDLRGFDVPGLVEKAFGSFGQGSHASGSPASGSPAPLPPAPSVGSAVDRRIVRFYHRPGSVQTEIRIGHVGLPRRVPDFHAVQLMSAILGGLFNSRLQMNLREEKGYTYSIGAGFDMRRAAGPFSVRTAVQTPATVPAIRECLAELDRMRETDVTAAELSAARDYLVGVFPLRFETPGAVVSAIAGLHTQGLPDDELAGYRDSIEAVAIRAVRQAAIDHIHPDRLAIVAVGDVDAVGADLEAGGFGEVEIVREADEGGADGGAVE
jgi:zinc protease